MQNTQHSRDRIAPETTDVSYQSLVVYRANLVENDVPGLALETAWNSKRIRMCAGRKRGHDEGTKIGVQFVRGDDQTRPRLPDFCPTGRVQVHKENITAADPDRYFHRHSSSSKRVGVGSSRSLSSSRRRIRRAASAQPARGRPTGVITTAPDRTRTSTSSVKPASSIFPSGRPSMLGPGPTGSGTGPR